MAQSVRMGLVGCGVVATRDIIPNLVRPEVREHVDLVAVCDLVEERVAAARRQFGVREGYTSVEDMLRRADIEMVGVVTPIRAHFPTAMAAIAAGKHVYLQKTMTDTVEEADRLIEATRARGVKLVASPGQQISPYIRQALREVKEIITSDRIGKVCWGRIMSHVKHETETVREGSGLMEVDPTWYYRPGGGPLKDRAAYEVHTLTWLLGPARRVTAFSGIVDPVRYWKGQRIDVQMDDSTMILLDFGDNVYFTIASTFVRGTSRAPDVEVYGTRGAVLLASFGPGALQGMYELWQASPVRGSYGEQDELKRVGPVPAPSQWGSGAHIITDILHLAECIREGREPAVTGEHARHVIEIFEKAYESAHTGQAQALTTTFEPKG